LPTPAFVLQLHTAVYGWDGGRGLLHIDNGTWGTN